MALTKVTDATVEPVTVAEARAHLRVDHSADDAYIATLITVARTAAEERCQRTFLETTWKVTMDEFPEAIRLPMPRIRSVESLTYVDGNGDTQTLSAPSYTLDAVSEPGFVVPAYGYSWPTTRDQINAVVCTYKAGYGTAATSVPAPIKQWILLAIGFMYEQRMNLNIGNIVTEFKFVDALLDPYRVYG